MPIWIVFAALASILATALLTWVLWRMNAPQGESAAPSNKRQSDDVAAYGASAGAGDDGGGDSGA